MPQTAMQTCSKQPWFLRNPCETLKCWSPLGLLPVSSFFLESMPRTFITLLFSVQLLTSLIGTQETSFSDTPFLSSIRCRTRPDNLFNDILNEREMFSEIVAQFRCHEKDYWHYSTPLIVGLRGGAPDPAPPPTSENLDDEIARAVALLDKVLGRPLRRVG